MNAELFGRLLIAMSEGAGNKMMEPEATADLMTLFRKAELIWANLVPFEGGDTDDDD